MASASGHARCTASVHQVGPRLNLAKHVLGFVLLDLLLFRLVVPYTLLGVLDAQHDNKRSHRSVFGRPYLVRQDECMRLVCRAGAYTAFFYMVFWLVVRSYVQNMKEIEGSVSKAPNMTRRALYGLIALMLGLALLNAYTCVADNLLCAVPGPEIRAWSLN